MLRFALLAVVGLAVAGCAHSHPAAYRPAPTDVKIRADVGHLLDSLHDAASKAQADRYFAHFTPDAVFIGTDAGERWTMEQFKGYALPLFAQGKGWTYTPRERHVQVSADGWAWFDELLDNARYGTCRGSGVLRQGPTGTWQIVQYDLSVPIPNDLLPKVADDIRVYEKSAK